MKKYVFIVWLFLYLNTAMAQDRKYIPIPSNMIIYGYEQYSSEPTDPTKYTDFRMEIGGDTVFNGIHYSKYYNWKSIAGGIRNDISEKRVYLYSIQTGTENLLYDFKLAVGDTILKNEGYGFYTPLTPIPDAVFTKIQKAWVSKIDSIKMPHDNLFHKQFHFNAIVNSGGKEVIVSSDSAGPYDADSNYKFYVSIKNLIEGVGFYPGTIGGAGAFEYHWYLQPYCISIDKKSIFEVIGPPYDKTLCNSIITGIVENKDKEVMNLYPNPSAGHFQLEVSTITDRFFEIYNRLGQKILEAKIKQQVTDIDLSALPKGIYFIRVFNLAGNSEMQKLTIY